MENINNAFEVQLHSKHCFKMYGHITFYNMMTLSTGKPRYPIGLDSKEPDFAVCKHQKHICSLISAFLDIR